MERPASTTETTTRTRGAHWPATPGAVPRDHLQLTSTHTRTPPCSCTLSCVHFGVLGRLICTYLGYTHTCDTCYSEPLSKCVSFSCKTMRYLQTSLCFEKRGTHSINWIVQLNKTFTRVLHLCPVNFPNSATSRSDRQMLAVARCKCLTNEISIS